jgi:hypothetical protein
MYEHRFQYPKVQEIRPGEQPAMQQQPPPRAQPTQRDLVVASLFARPASK